MTKTEYSPFGVVLHSSAALRNYYHIAILVAVTFLLYSNTLMVPWYFDDFSAVLGIPHPQNLDQVVRLLLSQRGFAKLTFVMNYSLGGLYLPGYHLVNISIHAGSTIVLYLVLKRVFRESTIYPFICALFFAVHPVQTQAVTYIVQRMAVLSGFFFLLSLYFYSRFKEKINLGSETPGVPALVYWGAAFLSGVLALLSKENAVILPAVLFLFDWYFLGGRLESGRSRLLRIIPFAAVPFLIAVVYLLLPLLKGASITTVSGTFTTLASSRDLNPWTYFITQFSVIWTYLRMLVVPYGITFDYAYPVVNSFFTLRTMVAGTGLAVLLLLAFRLRYTAPRIFFGIAWFFLTLAVESSFIPLDPLYVHRLYLPVAGFIIVVMDGMMRLPWRRGTVMALLSIVISIYAVVAWQRNTLWNDPVAYFEDNLRKAPQNERLINRLSAEYSRHGRSGDARRMLVEAVRINPLFAQSIDMLSNIYIDEGKNEEALELLKNGIRANPGNYHLHTSLGRIYSMAGQSGMAEYHLRLAISIKPTNGLLYCNLAVHYVGRGMLAEAEQQLRKALSVSRDEPMVHLNLGSLLLNTGQLVEARHELNQALKLDPKEGDVVYSLALAFMRLGDQQTARALHLRLSGFNPELAKKLASEM